MAQAGNIKKLGSIVFALVLTGSSAETVERTLSFAVTAESLAQDTPGGIGWKNNYSIYLDVTYADDSRRYGQCAAFDLDLGLGWQRGKALVVPSRPVSHVLCYLLSAGFSRRRAGVLSMSWPFLKRTASSSSSSATVIWPSSNPALRPSKPS